MYEGTSRATTFAVVTAMGAASFASVSEFAFSFAFAFDSERLHAAPNSETANTQHRSAAVGNLHEINEADIEADLNGSIG